MIFLLRLRLLLLLLFCSCRCLGRRPCVAAPAAVAAACVSRWTSFAAALATAAAKPTGEAGALCAKLDRAGVVDAAPDGNALCCGTHRAAATAATANAAAAAAAPPFMYRAPLHALAQTPLTNSMSESLCTCARRGMCAWERYSKAPDGVAGRSAGARMIAYRSRARARARAFERWSERGSERGREWGWVSAVVSLE